MAPPPVEFDPAVQAEQKTQNWVERGDFTPPGAEPVVTRDPLPGIDAGEINRKAEALTKLQQVMSLLSDTIKVVGDASKETEKKMAWEDLKKLQSRWEEFNKAIKDGTLKNTAAIKQMREDMKKELEGVGIDPDAAAKQAKINAATGAMSSFASSASGQAGMAMPPILTEAAAAAGPAGVLILGFGLAMMAQNMYRKEAGIANVEMIRMTGSNQQGIAGMKKSIDSLAAAWGMALPNEDLVRIKTFSNAVLGTGTETSHLTNQLVALDTILGQQVGNALDVARQKGVMFNQSMEENAASAGRFVEQLSHVTVGTDIWARQVYELYGRLGAMAPEVDKLFESMQSMQKFSGMGAGQAGAAVAGMYAGFQGASTPALAWLGSMIFKDKSLDDAHRAWMMRELMAGLRTTDLGWIPDPKRAGEFLKPYGMTFQDVLPDLITGIVEKTTGFGKGSESDAKIALMNQLFRPLGLSTEGPTALGIGNLLSQAFKGGGAPQAIEERFRGMLTGSPEGTKSLTDLASIVKQALVDKPVPWERMMKSAIAAVLNAINGAVSMLLGALFMVVGAVSKDSTYKLAAEFAFAQGKEQFGIAGKNLKDALQTGAESMPGSDIINVLDYIEAQRESFLVSKGVATVRTAPPGSHGFLFGSPTIMVDKKGNMINSAGDLEQEFIIKFKMENKDFKKMKDKSEAFEAQTPNNTNGNPKVK